MYFYQLGQLLLSGCGHTLNPRLPLFVVDNKELLEVAKQSRYRHHHRVVLGVAGKVVGNPHSLGKILARNGLGQLVVVVLFAYAYVLLDVVGGDELGALGQTHHQLVQLVYNLGYVYTHIVRNHTQCLLLDLAPLALAQPPRQPRAQLVVVGAGRLKHYTFGAGVLVELGALVYALALVGHHQYRRGRGCSGVEREGIDLAQRGGILYDYHQPAAHHRQLSGVVYYGALIGIFAVDDYLVECLFVLGQQTIGQQVGEAVDEESLLTHKQIYWGHLAAFDVGYNLLVLGIRIAKFNCLCHR